MARKKPTAEEILTDAVESAEQAVIEQPAEHAELTETVESVPVKVEVKNALVDTANYEGTKLSFAVILKNLSQEEGTRLKPYYCSAGHLTVGIGHNLDAVHAYKIIGRNVSVGDVITEKESSMLFDYDLRKVVDELNERLSWFGKLSPARQYVLISMAFNLGINGLMSFKNTLRSFELGNVVGMVNGMEGSLWYRQVKSRAKKLVNIVKTDKI